MLLYLAVSHLWYLNHRHGEAKLCLLQFLLAKEIEYKLNLNLLIGRFIYLFGGKIIEICFVKDPILNVICAVIVQAADANV